jgi:hypothetical protein
MDNFWVYHRSEQVKDVVVVFLVRRQRVVVVFKTRLIEGWSMRAETFAEGREEGPSILVNVTTWTAHHYPYNRNQKL